MGDFLNPDERRHFEEVAWRGAQPGDRDAVLTEIIAGLDAPLTREDKRGGWDDGLRRELRGFYGGLKACEAGETQIDSVGTLRALDAWGVTDGPLLESILTLAAKLNAPDIANPS
jgi:hypothetical protein